VLKWKDFCDEKLKLAGITNYFMISRDGGTGGVAFRRMYGTFLVQADCFLPGYAAPGELLLSVSENWDLLADDLMCLYTSADKQLLEKMSKQIQQLAYDEELVYKKVISILSCLLLFFIKCFWRLFHEKVCNCFLCNHSDSCFLLRNEPG
jgi:hypothetical protein